MQPSVSYTSLRDILPASPPTSPTPHNSSWNEIPIKNHLVKQAALAYLQPAGSLPEVGRKSLYGRLKDAAGECGCLAWLNDVVFRCFRDLFSRRRRSDETGDFDCDYCCDYDYEDDNRKVDF